MCAFCICVLVCRCTCVWGCAWGWRPQGESLPPSLLTWFLLFLMWNKEGCPASLFNHRWLSISLPSIGWLSQTLLYHNNMHRANQSAFHCCTTITGAELSVLKLAHKRKHYPASLRKPPRHFKTTFNFCSIISYTHITHLAQTNPTFHPMTSLIPFLFHPPATRAHTHSHTGSAWKDSR